MGGAIGHIKAITLLLFPHQRKICTEGLLGRYALCMLGRTLFFIPECIFTYTVGTVYKCVCVSQLTLGMCDVMLSVLVVIYYPTHIIVAVVQVSSLVLSTECCANLRYSCMEREREKKRERERVKEREGRRERVREREREKERERESQSASLHSSTKSVWGKVQICVTSDLL